MVSIIILSYNKRDLLIECLRSIYKNLKGEYEVIVVDHASGDDSVLVVKKEFPKAVVLDTKKNPGFGAGCNNGASHAHGETLLFLNSDTQVIDNSIFDMEKLLISREEYGVVGGLLQNHDGTPQRSFSNFYNIPEVAKLLFGGDTSELSSQNITHIHEVDWVSGGFMMVKRTVFEKVHGFDENIFMYIEDMELCYRIKKEGYSVLFFPNAHIFHLGQGSSNRTFAIVNIYKNLLYFYKKHRSTGQYILVKLLLITKGVASIAIGVVTMNKKLINRYVEALQF